MVMLRIVPKCFHWIIFAIRCTQFQLISKLPAAFIFAANNQIELLTFLTNFPFFEILIGSCVTLHAIRYTLAACNQIMLFVCQKMKYGNSKKTQQTFMILYFEQAQQIHFASILFAQRKSTLNPLHSLVRLALMKLYVFSVLPDRMYTSIHFSRYMNSEQNSVE